MPYSLTPAQEHLQQEVRAFAQTTARPRALELDRANVLDRELFRAIGERRWAGPIVPREHGGLGGGAVEYALIIEELAAACAPTPQINVQVEKMILDFGTPEQQARYLPRLSDGRWVAAEAISEPAAGSTLRTVESTAVRDGPWYVVNGTKSHVNLAADADLMAVFAKTAEGLTAFLMEAGTPGVTFTKQDPIGYRAHPIYDVRFEDCRLPVSSRLGPEGRAYDVFFTTFNLSRIGNASHFIGVARAALEDATTYISHRRVGRRLVKDFQGIRWIVADLAAKLEAVTIMRNYVAWQHDRGQEHMKETAMCKLLAAEFAEEITSKALQITGSHGAYRTQPFELYWRDVKAAQIGGGTAEIMRNLIARAILGKEEELAP
ncbi:MAG: acyl-CoA dehydrogenase family protein [Armatimonadota bacterium]|nr:acyl-CoA dehydrogenase family protein [Armatimonadota bacterium]MDR7535015.1 acyl-CoA dehydrogenase family protein [Armatimonadota bacterium]